MSEVKETPKTVIDKINAWFSKENIPAIVITDEKKLRMDKLAAFCADKTCGTIEKFEDLMTVDQIALVVEPAVEVGAAIATVVEGVGEPAPPATYELEDGRKIVVVEAGIIAEVMEPENEDTPPADEMPMNEDAKSLTEANSKIKRLIETVSKTQEFNEQLKAENKELKEAFSKFEARLSHVEKENDATKTGIHQFKVDTKEMLDEVFSIPAKPPVVEYASPFEKKKNIFTDL